MARSGWQSASKENVIYSGWHILNAILRDRRPSQPLRVIDKTVAPVLNPALPVSYAPASRWRFCVQGAVESPAWQNSSVLLLEFAK